MYSHTLSTTTKGSPPVILKTFLHPSTSLLRANLERTPSSTRSRTEHHDTSSAHSLRTIITLLTTETCNEQDEFSPLTHNSQPSRHLPLHERKTTGITNSKTIRIANYFRHCNLSLTTPAFIHQRRGGGYINMGGGW